MNTLSKLLFRNIIPPFITALLVLTFVLFFQYIGNRSELLISKNASLDMIFSIAATVIPSILIFSLPLSFLIGILIGLSGLSGESQITALRACGIPIKALLGFIMICACIVCILTGWMSTVVLPKSNYALSRMMDRVSLTLATSLVRPRIFNEDLPNIVFYVDDLANDKQRWSRVFLVDNSNPKSTRTLIAKYGSWVSDSEKRRLQLHLDQGKSYEINMDDPGKDSSSIFEATDIPIEQNHRTIQRTEGDSTPKKVAEQDTISLWNIARGSSQTKKIEQLVELHRRISLPFSVFPFALLGLALASGTHKGGKASGFAISLITVIVFYVLFFNGLRLASVGKISPFWGAWAANLLLLVAGLLLMTRVEHHFNIIHFLSLFPRKSSGITAKIEVQAERQIRRVAEIPHVIMQSTSYERLKFPKVLDIYISKGFILYFLWSLITCSTLFILLTLFDLLDDIIRNSIAITSVVDYFVFLTPQILMMAIPMSILLAILINFGILEKGSEVTAIKSGGWSLYRIAVPVFLIAMTLCIGLFLVQDYILPYANIRQDSIRNEIKGRPPQTSVQMQRKWIFGEAGRIYNYEYFDGNIDSFMNLNVYETDLASVRILKRIFAARARIDKGGKWILEDGWVRDYQSAQSGFRHIKSETFPFPERSGYFKREIFQPKESSKRTYFALKSYIAYLKKAGYNAAELQVELHKKASFPLSCLVMAILGVPFSFSIGKKGAFFGIGISIAIAISYWGVSGVFESLGSYGILIPILAAWAPNILFGAAGLALLLTIRT